MITWTVVIILSLILMLVIKRKWELHRDHIPNPIADPFLTFAEEERQQNKQMFSPWVTPDLKLLALAQEFFPDIALPQTDNLLKPDLTPVKIVPLKKEDYQLLNDQTDYFIAVGGPSAAMVAFQQAKNGKRVLYVDNIAMRNVRPIWAGAANHGETDVLSEAPAHITGHHPFKFLWREIERFINPSRYDKDVLLDDYPWLTLNIEDWLRHPRQIPAGLRVSWGNYRLAKKYGNKKQQTSHAANYLQLRARTLNSGEYLENFNQWHGKILRDIRGSLIAAPDEVTWKILLKDMQQLKEESRILIPITRDEAKKKYGIMPRNTFAMMEKTHDFIFQPHFLATIVKGIQDQGGEVIRNWRLTRILVDMEKKQSGIFEFCESQGVQAKKFYYRKFSTAHLSLGSTLYDPNPYDLVSVTGVSINALVFGTKLSGGPIICGGKGNHIAVVPLVEPQHLNNRDVSFIRIAAGGCVGPLNRGEDKWYSYSGQTAVNALHCLRKILPENTELKVLSVIGCNRLIGQDGRQVEINPFIRLGNKKIKIKTITIQIGAAGGGLTQMGTLPKLLESEVTS